MIVMKENCFYCAKVLLSTTTRLTPVGFPLRGTHTVHHEKVGVISTAQHFSSASCTYPARLALIQRVLHLSSASCTYPARLALIQRKLQEEGCN